MSLSIRSGEHDWSKRAMIRAAINKEIGTYMGALDGRIAIVTGGSSGIGLATAKRFVEEVAYVFITARRQSELDKALAEIGRNVTAIAGDLAKLEHISKIAAKVKADKGIIDIIVSNAGFTERSAIEDITPEHFDKTFNLMARAPVSWCRSGCR